jgi:hypothetical protein
MSQPTPAQLQPPTLQGPGPDTTPQDKQHLLLLMIFYYISAGLNLIGLCVGGLYLGIGIAMIGELSSNAATSPPQDEEVAYILAIVGGVTVALCLLTGVLQLLCAIAIQKRRRRTYCLVVAGLTCLSIPLGTSLGIYTFIALSRPGVIAMFRRQSTLASN